MCSTPRLKFHTVKIVVKDVRCPRLEASPGLSISDPLARALNDVVHLGCVNGNSLIGSTPLRCLPSGRWSHPTPACVSQVCPESIATNAPPALRVTVLGLGVGDRVAFACAAGFDLVGPTGAECRADGRW